MKIYTCTINSHALGVMLGSQHHAPAMAVLVRAARKADLIEVLTSRGVRQDTAAQIARAARVSKTDTYDMDTRAIMETGVLDHVRVLIWRNGSANPGILSLGLAQTQTQGTALVTEPFGTFEPRRNVSMHARPWDRMVVLSGRFADIAKATSHTDTEDKEES